MPEKRELIYPDLSYLIIGCAYDVFNEIGGGHKEAIYQKAMGLALKGKGMSYTDQQYYPVRYKDVVVGKNFFDFYIENKIVVEIKSAAHFSKSNYDQVVNYLHVSNVKLALLLSFGPNEVRCKRVINFKELNKDKEQIQQQQQ